MKLGPNGQSGLCPNCSEPLFPDKIHGCPNPPAPWRWKHDDDDGAYLEDANGQSVFGGCPRGWFCGDGKAPEPRAARVRALTEAAPELAEALSDTLNALTLWASEWGPGMREKLHGYRALLSRIEERSWQL